MVSEHYFLILCHGLFTVAQLRGGQLRRVVARVPRHRGTQWLPCPH